MERIDTELERLEKFPAYVFVLHHYPKAFHVDIFAKAVYKFDPGFGVVFGEFIHNLRSCLDHLVWALAVRNLGRLPTEEEAKQIQFPIRNSYTAFKKAKVLTHLPKDARALLQRCQPYKRRYRYRIAGHPLAQLARWSNIDKHRTLHPAVFYPEIEDIQRAIVPVGSTQISKIRMRVQPGRPLQDGAHVARIYLTRVGDDPASRLVGGNLSVKMEGELAHYVGVEDEAPGRGEMEPISDLPKYVSTTVDLLEPLITRLPW